MSFSPVISALALPPESRVDQRIPKKLLLEQSDATAADKRLLQDGIEDLNWIAALKPTTVGVPEYRDDIREYLEIAVLSATLRSSAKVARISELIHRAIPYPLLLIVVQGEVVSISLAHKRWSQGEAGKVVIEDVQSTSEIRANAAGQVESAFFKSLALSNVPSRDLFVVYQGWLDCVAALEAAQITGSFTPPGSPDRGSALRDGLEAHTRLRREISLLRAQATKEKQTSRRVELNLEVKRLEAELVLVGQTLKGETP